MVFHTILNLHRLKVVLGVAAAIIVITAISLSTSSKSIRNSSTNNIMQNSAAGHDAESKGEKDGNTQPLSTRSFSGFGGGSNPFQSYYGGGFGGGGYYGGGSSSGYSGGGYPGSGSSSSSYPGSGSSSSSYPGSGSSSSSYPGSGSSSSSYPGSGSSSSSYPGSGSSSSSYPGSGSSSSSYPGSGSSSSSYPGSGSSSSSYPGSGSSSSSSSNVDGPLEQYYDGNGVSNADSALIVAIVSKKTKVDDLCDSMKTLKMLQGLQNSLIPVMIMYTSDVNVPSSLNSCTDRNVSFHPISLTFPPGFEPDSNIDYSSALLNRFWTTHIWEESVLDPYEIIMTIDDDTCFTMPELTLPFIDSEIDYHSQAFPGTQDINSRRMPGLYDFITEYMEENFLSGKNYILWQKVLTVVAKEQSIPVFQDSLEIVRKSFMLDPDVKAFHYALTEFSPYGYFSQDWTSDAERFLTAAIFGTSNSIETKAISGYIQKDLDRNVRNIQACKIPFESSS